MNKVVLTYTSALVRFLYKTVSTVKGYGQDKIIHQFRKLVILTLTPVNGHVVVQLVEALHYKPKGHGFDSRWCHLNFSLT